MFVLIKPPADDNTEVVVIPAFANAQSCNVQWRNRVAYVDGTFERQQAKAKPTPSQRRTKQSKATKRCAVRVSQIQCAVCMLHLAGCSMHVALCMLPVACCTEHLSGCAMHVDVMHKRLLNGFYTRARVYM